MAPRPSTPAATSLVPPELGAESPRAGRGQVTRGEAEVLRCGFLSQVPGGQEGRLRRPPSSLACRRPCVPGGSNSGDPLGREVRWKTGTGQEAARGRPCTALLLGLRESGADLPAAGPGANAGEEPALRPAPHPAGSRAQEASCPEPPGGPREPGLEDSSQAPRRRWPNVRLPGLSTVLSPSHRTCPPCLAEACPCWAAFLDTIPQHTQPTRRKRVPSKVRSSNPTPPGCPWRGPRGRGPEPVARGPWSEESDPSLSGVSTELHGRRDSADGAVLDACDTAPGPTILSSGLRATPANKVAVVPTSAEEGQDVRGPGSFAAARSPRGSGRGEQCWHVGLPRAFLQRAGMGRARQTRGCPSPRAGLQCGSPPSPPVVGEPGLRRTRWRQGGGASESPRQIPRSQGQDPQARVSRSQNSPLSSDVHEEVAHPAGCPLLEAAEDPGLWGEAGRPGGTPYEGGSWTQEGSRLTVGSHGLERSVMEPDQKERKDRIAGASSRDCGALLGCGPSGPGSLPARLSHRAIGLYGSRCVWEGLQEG
ncbi:collagen alpha-1(III) chain-like [Mustela lutreola]|uniref:collagen alpha-1(III) chain-like n=1 Tax=Mustela lutreola TaxID=9666 RepID=UPI00279750DC|nr:collagen alpha-1(III) chain-like [Mustela lutreola]